MTFDFTATALIVGQAGDSGNTTGIITENFNITTAGAPYINIATSSITVDANQTITITFTLNAPVTINFYQTPLLLSNFTL